MRQSIEKRLEVLKRKKNDLEKQIKQFQNEQALALRKRQQKRESLVGKAIYALIESGVWSEQKLNDIMDDFLVRQSERKLFGLLIDVQETSATEEDSITTNTENIHPQLSTLHHSPNTPSPIVNGSDQDSAKQVTFLPESSDDLIAEFNL